jgi:anaerobic glycerol-3-phosphate dehydrogenase
VSDRGEVVVVGAGVAGAAAALAAREAGAETTVLRSSGGASALSGGTWDVATDASVNPLAAARSLSERLHRFVHAQPFHPYARLPEPVWPAIVEAHGRFFDAVGGEGVIDDDTQGALVATTLGLFRRTDAAADEVLDLATCSARTIGVAIPEAYPELDGGFIARSLTDLAERAGNDRRFLAVPFDTELSPGWLPHELAASFDDREPCRALGSRLRAAADHAGVDALILAPMLGLEADDARSEIEAAVGRPVGELVGALASPQALRRQRRIERAMVKAGVRLMDRAVQSLVLRPDGTRVVLEDGEELAPRAIVLATGKLVGGGIAHREGRLVEALAGLPLYEGERAVPLPSAAAGPDPRELFGTDWLRPGPGYRHGVGFDEKLRVLDGHGRPAALDLFAAGAVLAGVDPARDGTGLGVSVTTGTLAGRAAAADASGRSERPPRPA